MSESRAVAVAWLVGTSVVMCGINGCVKPIQNSIPPPRTTAQTEEQPLWSRSGDGDATRAYGRLKVKPGAIGPVESARKPWSGYWYSVQSRFLFQAAPHEPSPLERYDQWVRKAHGKEISHAAEYEKERIYNPTPQDDRGLWSAWATASVMEPEPSAPRKIDGVEFEVGDLKALLVMTYEILPPGRLVTFGQKVEGALGPQWRDIPPDQFHRVLEAELLEHRHPVLLGHSSLSSYWIAPIYAAKMNLWKDSMDPHLMHVETSLTATDYLGDPLFFPGDRNFVGTRDIDIIYTYDLYGLPQEDGSLDVRSGQWTGGSAASHPDFVSALTGWNLPRNSYRGTSGNPEVKTQFVNEILGKKPDSLIHPPIPGISHHP